MALPHAAWIGQVLNVEVCTKRTECCSKVIELNVGAMVGSLGKLAREVEDWQHRTPPQYAVGEHKLPNAAVNTRKLGQIMMNGTTACVFRATDVQKRETMT